MKVVILDPDYPAADNLYGDVFVHTRVKSYPKDWQIHVTGLNPFLKHDKQYTYEEVKVFLSNDAEKVKSMILSANPQLLVIHFIQYQLMDFILSLNIPLAVFVHGYEALGWYRRLFDYQTPGALKYLPAYVRSNTTQLWKFRSFIKEANKSSHIVFVFVSEWMHRIASADMAVQIKNYRIIPNGVNQVQFPYQPKPEAIRKNILLIRSFNSRKYAVDVAVEAIIMLSRKKFFKELQFSIYGRGYLYAKYTDRLKHFENVSCCNIFLTHDQIKEIHKTHGIFLCPTRQDAQGVSMSEAMCSGLVPITSNNTAIPEFVEDGFSGFLTTGPSQIANRIEQLYTNPEDFLRMSKQAHLSIVTKCSNEVTLPMEIELIRSLSS